MEFDYRKIIKFGNSSHVISLPNQWLKKNNLNKGDKIFYEETTNNEIILFTTLKENKEKVKKMTIDANNKSLDYITNSLFFAYMNDYNLIKIIDKKLDVRSNEIRSTINSLAGLEVIEQKSDVIIAKDFLNIKDISFDAIVRRIDILIKNMLVNTKECFDIDHRVSITNSDFDVNRLFYVLIKVSSRAMESPQIAKEMGLSYFDIMHYYRLVTIQESFGDECKRLARLFRESKSRKKQLSKLIGFFEIMQKTYHDAMTSLYNQDIELGFGILESIRDEINNINTVLEDNVNPVDARIVEKLKYMLVLIKRITRVSLNLSLYHSNNSQE